MAENKTTKKPSTTKKPANKKPTTKKSTPKKTPTKKPKVLVSESVVKKQAVSKTLEKKEKTPRKRGKSFYLIFAIIVFTASFFYINNVVYDNTDYIQSAVFAFMVVFVVFMLMNFNVHMIFINFFRLPIKYLIEEAKLSFQKEVISDKEKKPFRGFGKHKALFALIFYSVLLLLLVGSQVYAGILDQDKVLVIITQSGFTGLIYVMIVCSWQYLFNIIPNILEKSIDARNGFILTLSAIAMIVYVIFMVFNITYLAEAMLFILIIGFIALLGVNLNMIVGEINIFSNLKNRQNKTVARIVFMIFFGFHLYVILYASVIAFSIYSWNNNAYNFVNTPYNDEIYYDDIEYYNFNTMMWEPIGDIVDPNGEDIDKVYNRFGEEITQFVDSNNNLVTEIYDEDGFPLQDFYVVIDDSSPTVVTQMVQDLRSGDVEFEFGGIGYYNGTLVGYTREEVKHSYGDFLYYTVVTVSTLGYGDITPNTNYTTPKVWGAFLGIYGVTFYALSIGFVSNIAIEGAQRKED